MLFSEFKRIKADSEKDPLSVLAEQFIDVAWSLVILWFVFLVSEYPGTIGISLGILLLYTVYWVLKAWALLNTLRR